MKAVRFTGLLLFLFSLGLFLGSFFMGSYTLTEEGFQSIVKEAHQPLLKSSLRFNESFGSSISFVNHVKAAVERINETARAEQRWGDVIYDDYGSSLTRTAAQGFVVQNEGLLFILIYVVGAIGSLMFILPAVQLNGPPGIKNNHIFHRHQR